MVRIRGMEIGTGRPKVCVPITGRNREMILEQAKNIASLSIEVVEWRADYADFIKEKQQVVKVLGELRDILEGKILLFTFRSIREGGEQELSAEQYLKLNAFVAETKLIDMIDLELYTECNNLEETITQIHKSGCKVIMSNHDFKKTPDETELLERLNKMDQVGADILKIAVMPEKPMDVITLLSATCKAKEQLSKPVVTMSMDKLGVISRLTGEVFGSAMTFGTVGEASAPGQVPVKELEYYLDFFSS